MSAHLTRLAFLPHSETCEDTLSNDRLWMARVRNYLMNSSAVCGVGTERVTRGRWAQGPPLTVGCLCSSTSALWAKGGTIAGICRHDWEWSLYLKGCQPLTAVVIPSIPRPSWNQCGWRDTPSKAAERMGKHDNTLLFNKLNRRLTLVHFHWFYKKIVDRNCHGLQIDDRIEGRCICSNGDSEAFSVRL